MLNYYNIHTHNLNSDRSECSTLIYNCTYPQKESLLLSESNLYFSIGIHPWDIETATDISSQLYWIEESLRTNTKIVALGECGLDKLITTNINIQEELFNLQIDLAENTGTPIIIHCVKAWAELLKIHKKRKSHIPWIIHGFRGNKDLMLQLYKSGFFFSLGEFYNQTSLINLPLDRILLETDNSKKDIVDIYKDTASALGVSIEYLCKRINQNVSFFSF